MNISSENIASLDIDAQYTFTPACPQELPVPDALSIVDELNAQVQFAHYRIGTKDAHPMNAIWVMDDEHPMLSPLASENVDTYWPRHAVPGTKGFELIAGLPKVTAYDFFVWKGIEPDLHPYGGCYHDAAGRLSTGLIEFLRIHNIKLLIVGGLATDYCVKITVLQLLQVGFKVIVNLGACRGIAPTTTAEAIVEMQAAGAIMINSAVDLPSLLTCSPS